MTAKNFATIYDSPNDSIALESTFFIKEETTRGTLEIPTDTDALRVLAGAAVNLQQPKESSPQRSGRHHSAIIKQKKITEWTIPTLVNIDTGVAQGTTELDQAMRTLLESTFGRETVPAAVVYDAQTAPSITFSVFENTDVMAKQASGAFVNSFSLEAPGDGNAQYEFSGNAKDALYIGIGKTTTDNNAGNDVTLQAGEGKRMEVGGLVMLVESDGVTRSADTPNGSPRRITAIAGDVITLDGAVLADADGASSDIYLTYYEPETPTSIDGIQTGLEGSVTIDNLTTVGCVRNFSLSIENNHTIYDNCYGEDSLGGPLFAPGGRIDVNLEMELILSKDKVGYLNDKKQFVADAIEFVLGDSTTRHLFIDLPNMVFDLPTIETPEDGVVPLQLTNGMALEQSYLAGDEISFEYR